MGNDPPGTTPTGSGVKLDTSGIVGSVGRNRHGRHWWSWSDLPSDFVSGYTAALLEAAGAAYHQLAPETLWAILKDCEAEQAMFGKTIGGGISAAAGRAFWIERNRPNDPADRWAQPLRDAFPPLTVYFSDDGKVRFRDGGSTSATKADSGRAS